MTKTHTALTEKPEIGARVFDITPASTGYDEMVTSGWVIAHCEDGDDWIEVRFDDEPDEICPCRWDELSA